jgi:UDP-glucuronate 4-epimerase
MTHVSHTILVTGAAGFIGFHVASSLLENGFSVVGLDNLNDYYDVHLKEARLAILKKHAKFCFFKADIADKPSIDEIFETFQFEYVVNLAAQAGVRYSLVNPHAYAQSNVVGFLNLLECCRKHSVKHLVYASTSSVYGLNKKSPFAETDNVDHPVSLYAATKKSNELMAHSYSHLFRIPTTGLRFFTVYGPWGRPDMAMYLFAKSMKEGKPIQVFNYGKMRRDFTYIDDIVQGVTRVLFQPAEANPAWDGTDPSNSLAPYRVYNIGNNKPVELLYAIELLEKELGITAFKQMQPLQAGDVESTFADIDALAAAVAYSPSTPIEIGIKKFVQWFKDYEG